MKKTKNLVLLLSGIVLIAISCQKQNVQNDDKGKSRTEAFQKEFRRTGGLLAERLGPENLAGRQQPISEGYAQTLLEPLVIPSSNYLATQFGINIHEYLQPGDPAIVTLGELAARLYQLEQQNYSVDTSLWDDWNGSLPTASFNPGSGPDLGECLTEAFGIPIGLILGNAEGTTRKAILKAAKKLASRTLGWVALAYAVYDFGDCMEWW